MVIFKKFSLLANAFLNGMLSTNVLLESTSEYSQPGKLVKTLSNCFSVRTVSKKRQAYTLSLIALSLLNTYPVFAQTYSEYAQGYSDSYSGPIPEAGDLDQDGLRNIDEFSAGTQADNKDTDGDGVGDWYEVKAAFTDPNDAQSKPNVPYPLPAHDGSTPSSSKPVKVYIMSGQSNMVGFGRISGDGPGTLNTLTNDQHKFPNLIHADTGAWKVRTDVHYQGVISAKGNSPLKPGFGANSSSFGPELGFGQIMGHYHEEPVLIIKCSIGNRSLAWDYLPPGSKQHIENDSSGSSRTFAGYGDSPSAWDTGTSPAPKYWYAGKQFDDCFIDENERPLAGGSHSSVTNVVDILDNFNTRFSAYAAQGFEIAGYVWWQGHKDQSSVYSKLYEKNLVNLIKQIRSYYEARYPFKTIKNAPFVLANVAFDGGYNNTKAVVKTIANAQMAVSGEQGNYPEFEDNVKMVEARGYWRPASESPKNQGYHYNHNAETYMLVGDALGRGMIDLISGINTGNNPSEENGGNDDNDDKGGSDTTEVIRLEAENFDDRSNENDQSITRIITFEDSTSSVPSKKVGYIRNGEWIKFNNIDLSNGLTSVSIKASNRNSKSVAEFYLGHPDDSESIAIVPIKNTSNWDTFDTSSSSVPSSLEINGFNDLYILFKSSEGNTSDYLYDIDFLELNYTQDSEGETTPPQPTNPTIKLEYEGENYTSESNDGDNDQIRNETTHVGYIKDGNWIGFSNVQLSAQMQSITLSASSPKLGGTIEFRLGHPTNGEPFAVVNVGVTGNWGKFSEFSGPLSVLDSTEGDLYLTFKNPGKTKYLFNLDYFRFNTE